MSGITPDTAELFDIIAPVSAAIQSTILDKDDHEAVGQYTDDIGDIFAKLGSLLDEMEESNQHDAQNLGELNEILEAQQERLNDFNAFVQSVAEQHAKDYPKDENTTTKTN